MQIYTFSDFPKTIPSENHKPLNHDALLRLMVMGDNPMTTKKFQESQQFFHRPYHRHRG